MAVERVFLDWNGPCLEKGADYLLTRYRPEENIIDMRAATLILPGSRAERRLLEILVQRAEEAGAFLLPPQRRTVGALPELLYRPRHRLASALQCQLAWLSAFRQATENDLQAIAPREQSPADFLGLRQTLV